ncbi:MAG: FISUMP domain-containing protein, partial [Mariniphaga sp.]
NRGATNETGFTALPGGYRSANGKYGLLTENGYFWTLSSKDNNAIYRLITSYGITIDRDYKQKSFGLSVRCIKN